jgi:hypothetical protein
LFALSEQELHFEILPIQIRPDHGKRAMTYRPDYLIKAVLLLSTQHFGERAGKCDMLLLLSGIKSIWHLSPIKSLRCQIFAQNAQARSFRNPEVSGEQFAGQKRAFFSHGKKYFDQITFSSPARSWIIGQLGSSVAKARVPLADRRQGECILVRH